MEASTRIMVTDQIAGMALACWWKNDIRDFIMGSRFKD
jgi:hypothetical protein